MTLTEMSNFFDIEYQTASKIAPDLSIYEKSYFLTRALEEIIDEAVTGFEYKEISKRLLQPLIKTKKVDLKEVISDYPGIIKTLLYLPKDFRVNLKEIVVGMKCPNVKKVVTDKLDNLSESMFNPFRKPNRRKVIRVIGGDAGNLDEMEICNMTCDYPDDSEIPPQEVESRLYDIIYSVDKLEYVKITYVKKHSPIILDDLINDIYNSGNDTILGKNTKSETELKEEFHKQIIKQAVVLAIVALRANSIDTKMKI